MNEQSGYISFRSWWQMPRRRWIPLVAAALLTVAVTKLCAGPGSALGLRHYMVRSASIGKNVRGYLLYLVVAVPFAAPWLILRLRRGWHVVAVILAACLGELGWIVQYRNKIHLDASLHQPPQLWAPVLMVLGAAALAGVIAEAVRKHKSVQLALALWLLIPLSAVVYTQLPLKYLAAVSPAVAILLAGLVEQDRRRFRLAVVSVFLVASAGLSWLILRANQEFAETARRVSAEVIAPRVASGQRVWCAGDWGFYWYAQEAGATLTVPGRQAARAGDVLVVGQIEGGMAALPRFPRRTLIERRIFYASGGRTLSPENDISLYTNIFAHLPWGWAPGELDRYEVWRIDDSNEP
jgi:hypothetical protein